VDQAARNAARARKAISRPCLILRRPTNRLKVLFWLVKMTALGIAMIVAGLTLICGSMIFRLFRGPSSSEESLEERLERTEHHLDEIRRERGELSAPTEYVPNDRERCDE